jgi:hypothetical protein
MAGQELGMTTSGRQTAPPRTEAVLVTSACRSPQEANPRGSDAPRAASGLFFERSLSALTHAVAPAASAFRILSAPRVSPA